MENYQKLAKKFKEKNYQKLSFTLIKEELMKIIGTDEDKYTELAEGYETDWFKEMENGIIGNIEIVDQEGGSDQGSHWHSVLHFTEHNVYIKIIGYYSSYEGTEFAMFDKDYFKEVFPVEKTITVYE